jgi:tetratricopeptide (TPR) repeat protein
VQAINDNVWEQVIACRSDVQVAGAVALQATSLPPGQPQALAGCPAQQLSSEHHQRFIRLVARRAASLCQFGEYAAAEVDLRCAAHACTVVESSGEPTSTQAADMDEDAQFMQQLVQAAECMTAAKVAAVAGNFEEATALFGQAVELSEGSMVEALLNRASCQAQLQRFPEAVDDCTAALRALMDYDATDLFTAVPPLNSQRSRDLKLQVLSRRGLLLGHLGLWEDCLPDLRSALSLNPTDEVLRKDMQLAVHKVAVVEHTVPAPADS